MTGWLLLGMTVCAGAQADAAQAAPETPLTLVVHVEPALTDEATGAVVDADALVQALALRLSSSAIVVEADAVTPAPELSWRVRLRPFRQGILAVDIVEPHGAPYRTLTLLVRWQRPADVAETVSIGIVEALAQVVPAVARAIAPPPTTMDRQLAEPAPAAPERPWVADAGVAGALQALTPRHHVTSALGLSARIRRGPLQLALEGLVYRRLRAEGVDYRVQVTQGELFGTAGVSVPLGPGRVQARAGGSWRLLRIEGSGVAIVRGVRYRDHWGAALHLGVDAPWRRVIVGVGVTTTWYVGRIPRIVVDGVRQVHPGKGAALLHLELRIPLG